MAWTEDIWTQDDSKNDGLPFITDAGSPVAPDFNSICLYWHLDTPMPIPFGTYYIDSIDYNTIPFTFSLSNNNFGMPNASKIDFGIFGSFLNASNLRSIKIPPTVKFIDYYSFNNTQLESVVVAPDCFYYKNTFPPNCQITYYQGRIDHVEFENGDIDITTFPTGGNIESILNKASIMFTTTDGANSYTQRVHSYTYADFDLSQDATDLVGSITFTTVDGSQTYTKYIRYNVQTSSTLLSSSDTEETA